MLPSLRAVCDSPCSRCSTEEPQGCARVHRRSARSSTVMYLPCSCAMGKSGILTHKVSEPSPATVATQSWQPAVSSRPSQHEGTHCCVSSIIRPTTRNDPHNRWLQGDAGRARVFFEPKRRRCLRLSRRPLLVVDPVRITNYALRLLSCFSNRAFQPLERAAVEPSATPLSPTSLLSSGHSQGVEHPRWYAVPADVARLQ